MLTRHLIVLFATVAIALPLNAQTPGQRGGGQGQLQNSAQFLLSHATDLNLTDAQLVQLAEIARQAEARGEEMRAQMQELRPAPNARQQMDSAEREQMRARFQERREQMLQDRERALQVLSTEQQARAWELLARAAPQRGGDRMRGARGRN